VQKEAVEQVKAGADILDVNVTLFGIDETPVLPKAIEAVQEVTDVPLCIDSANVEALKAALRVYKGKPLVNSVTGEDKSLDRVLPLIKEYNAAVIGLTQDDNGIPKDSFRRIAIAEKIVNRAEQIGINRNDIVIDCLAMAIGAEPMSLIVLLETIRAIKSRLGVNMTLGASNISFGMPDRDLLNSSFLALVVEAGVTCPVVDAVKVRQSVLATDVLLNKDKRSRRYLNFYMNNKLKEPGINLKK
jgi:5-methyltetrahydrofolate--homocysteine methyltransferase